MIGISEVWVEIMLKILFLVSGSGGNLKFLCHAQQQGIISNCVFYVIADRECGASEYSHKNGITYNIIQYSKTNPSLFQEILQTIKPDIIITTWSNIISADIVKSFRGTLINLHYSLLPAFGGIIGIKPIEMAKTQGCKYVGVSSHFLDEGVDTGKIICQAIVKVDDDFVVPDVMEQIFKKGCKIMLNSILLITEAKIIKEGRDEDFSFSPSLKFEQALFSNEFWERIKIL
jgi:phosphoribosylglycinamide formyltransferase-1